MSPQGKTQRAGWAKILGVLPNQTSFIVSQRVVFTLKKQKIMDSRNMSNKCKIDHNMRIRFQNLRRKQNYLFSLKYKNTKFSENFGQYSVKLILHD